MKPQTLQFENGDSAVVYYDMEASCESDLGAQCNICGLHLGNRSFIPWWADSDGAAVSNFAVCPECQTQWGVDDSVGPMSSSGSVSKLWTALRLSFLDANEWADELVKRIEDNLHITRAELEAARDARDEANP